MVQPSGQPGISILCVARVAQAEPRFGYSILATVQAVGSNQIGRKIGSQ
jgi:hypothetical protein